MGPTLPHNIFLLILICVTGGLIALFYLAIRKSGKLRDLVGFIACPKENGAFDLKIDSLLKTLLWFLIINLSLTILYQLIDLTIFNDESPANSIADISSTLPLWSVLLLPPLLEETAFRLPLKRKRSFITLSVTLIIFIASAPLFSSRVYEIVWPKMALSAAVAITLWCGGYRWIQKIDFRAWFWLLAISFSLLHLINYDLETLNFTQWVRIILKEAIKLPGALILGYTRLRHGFAPAVTFHLLNNLFPFILLNTL